MSPVAPFDRQAPKALAALAAVMVLTAVGFRVAATQLSIYLRKEPVELRASLDVIPSRLGPWVMEGESRKFGAEMIEELGTSKYVDRTYRLGDGPRARRISLHVAYYTGIIDAVPHVPDRCLVAGGFDATGRPTNLALSVDDATWTVDAEGPVNTATGEPYRLATRRDPLTGRTTSVRLPVGDLALRTTSFTSEKMRGDSIWAGYFFVANGRIAVTPEQVKRLAFRPQEKYAYYCKVQILEAGQDLSQSDFTADAASLLEHLLPELMYCLPDWSQVEMEDGAVAPATDAR